MINIRFIINLLGKLMLIESACFLLCVLISLLYRENNTLAFLYSTLITGGTGSNYGLRHKSERQGTC